MQWRHLGKRVLTHRRLIATMLKWKIGLISLLEWRENTEHEQ